MSLEHGDLEILLGGMTESDYENTVSVGQLRVQTGEILAAELKNYAANYYATGNSEIDLEGALALLKERKKELEKEEREKRQLISEKKERAEMEASYVWRDLHQLENEAEQLKRSCEEKRREWESWVNEDKKRKKREEAAGYFAGWRFIHCGSEYAGAFCTFRFFISRGIFLWQSWWHWLKGCMSGIV